MKHFSVLLLCVLLAHFSSNAQNKSKPANAIRPYWFVMLIKGANRSQDNATAIAAGRLAYVIHPWYIAPTGSFLPGVPPAEETETEKQ